MGDTAEDPRFHLGPWRPVGLPSERSAPVRAWTAVAEPAHVTIGLVCGESGCLVVDTGSSPAQGAEIRSRIREVTDQPLRAVVVTHAHFDHWFGLAGFAGVDSIGHESLAEGPDGGPDTAAGEEARAAAAGLGVDPAELVAPTRGIAVAASVDLGGVRVEVAHLGRGHTAGDVVVVVGPAGARPVVVFAGDLLESSGPPSFGADRWPLEWPATLDGVIGLLGADTVVVPGHGPVMARDEVFAQRGEIGAVAGELQRLVEAGVPIERAAQEGQWPYPLEQVRAAIPGGYAELARQGVRARKPNLLGPLHDHG